MNTRPAACGWLARLGDQRVSYTAAVSFAGIASAPCDAVLTFDRAFAIAGFRLRSPAS